VLGVEHTVIESVELETDERGQELLVARACGHLNWPRLGRSSSRMLAPLGW
jgi:hypothetical protein